MNRGLNPTCAESRCQIFSLLLVPAYDVHAYISMFVPLALPWLLPWAVVSLLPQLGALPSEDVLA